MQVLGKLICVLCTVGFGMFVWVYVAGSDAELIVLSVIWMDPVSPWPVVLVWVSITQQLSVTGNLLCARYFMYFGSFTRILQSRHSYHYFIHEESRTQRGYLLKVTQVCGRCRICPWISLKPKLVLLTAILLLTFSTTASPSERDSPGWRAHTEDMSVTSFPIRCSLFQMVFEECAWTFFLCAFACLVTAILWLVVSVWLVYLIVHFFVVFFICGEQNRNMADGFACFSGVQHAESSLSWSLELFLIAVTSDSKQFRVAEWPKAWLCYLRDLIPPPYPYPSLEMFVQGNCI